MKGCPKKEEWVLYAAGEAPHRRRRALEAHLESCVNCREEVRGLARGLAAMEHLDREPSLRPEVMESLRRRLCVAAAHRRPGIPSLVWRYRWVAAAAALVVAALVWSAATPTSRAPQPDNGREMALEDIAVAVELLELADNGARVARRDAPLDDATIENVNLLLKLDEAGLLLDYLQSRDNSM